MTRTRYLIHKPRWPGVVVPPAGITIPSTKQKFFGANIHIGSTASNYPQNQTVQSYVDKAVDLGLGWYRTNCSSAGRVTANQPYFTAMRANGVEPFMVIDAGINLNNSYTTNYSNGRSLGLAIGQAAKGYCRYFETSNEIDYVCRIDHKESDGVTYTWPAPHNLRTDGTTPDGGRAIDFYGPAVESWMGWNTGVLDGLRFYIPDAQVGYATGAGFGCYVFNEMWQKGLDVNGNKVRDPVDISFNGLHWYWSMGDPRTAAPHGEGTLNVLQECYRRTGVPTFVTEWGSSLSDMNRSDATQASQLTTRCGTYWNNRVADHVAGVMFYAMFPNPTNEGDDPVSPNWGLVQADGNTIKQAYTAYKNFIAA